MTDPMSQHDYYEILQVHPKATLAVIKKAYRTLLLELGNHPDQGGDRDTAALITEAYHVLSDPERRASYDRDYFRDMPRRAPEEPAATAPAADASSLIVLCPRCRTKNRVRSQELLAVAKCSKCTQPLSRLPNKLADLREHILGMIRDAQEVVRDRQPAGARAGASTRSASEPGPIPRPPRSPRAAKVSRFFAVGIPVVLIGASLVASGYALFDMWQGFGDPVETASLLTKQGKLDQAEARLRRAMNRDPENPRLYELLGDVYAKQNDHYDALENYTQAAKLNPQSNYYLDLQGGEYQQLGQLAQAEMCYKRSLQLDPDYAPALVALGNIRAKNQSYDDAVRLYKQALHGTPSSDVYYNLGMVYTWENKAADAVGAFKQALHLDPNNRSSMVSLASLYYEQRQYDLAAAQLMKASAIKHTDLDLHLRLADIYERTGHTSEAIREWNVCLEQGKGNPVVVEKVHHALERLHVSSDG